ncbi:MAG: hypothetical protein J0L94_05745 [Rhodothermia bacterium]|nr:hypothetical protein [Rhodothermia bacterium]
MQCTSCSNLGRWVRVLAGLCIFLLLPKATMSQTPAATFAKQVAERQIAYFKEKMGLDERELSQFLDFYESYQIGIIRLDRLKKQQYEMLSTALKEQHDPKQVEKMAVELGRFEERLELVRQIFHGDIIRAFGAKRFAQYLLAQWEFVRIVEQMRNEFIQRQQRESEKNKS